MKRSAGPRPALFISSNQPTDTRTQTQASDRKRGKKTSTQDKNTQGCLGIVSGVCWGGYSVVQGGQNTVGGAADPTLLMSAPTHSLDVSIHLEHHSHTPPRDGTSSVGPRLNYSSSSVPVHPSPPLHSSTAPPSLSPLSAGTGGTQRHVGTHSLTPTRKAAASAGGKKSEEDTHTRCAA